MDEQLVRNVKTDALWIAHVEHGPTGGWPVILSHGFPYDVIDVSRQRYPVTPSLERVFWYQHLFQTERGRECLTEHRRELGRMLWSEWSPGWQFDEETFARTAAAFQNPDFVDVVIHCCRWVFGLQAGDPALQPLEDHLAQRILYTRL